MKKLLNILGIITLVGAIIISTFSGVSNDGFIGAIGGFLAGVVGGIFAAAVFFGLAAILGGQEEIVYKLDNLNPRKSGYNLTDKITCTKCKKEYDPDYSSCPYCGFKE